MSKLDTTSKEVAKPGDGSRVGCMPQKRANQGARVGEGTLVSRRQMSEEKDQAQISSDGGSVGAECLYSISEVCSYYSSKIEF